ncbi:GH92 family glycosyl hydrolase [Burkholderia sp. TSV86]|uniref:GH92 family glycosyl hydrolase n=1 Tax=Burkholderia sp. TSV86 TaxID=1385594 RepID=UPI0007550925|nr:GH92 family glycosyl hydrolase [Burkholderia sp. TSV86]KVE32542.1 alpha-mannosidase [Burkholderia sp. TSV86]
MKHFRSSIVAALIGAALAACGGDDTVTGGPSVAGIMSPVSASTESSTATIYRQQPAKPGRVDLALTQFVNPLIGTAVSGDSGYAGNVNPGAKVPFGMVNFGPNTPRQDFNGSGGYLSAVSSPNGTIDFFSMTHLSGVGCPGQGTVAMLPNDNGAPIMGAWGPSGVGYSHRNEAAEPGYYKVKLDTGIMVELSATARTGSARIRYTDKSKGFLSIDTTLNGNSDASGATPISPSNVALTVGRDGKSISGQSVAPAFCTPYGTPWNSPVYFHATFDKPLRTQPGSSRLNTASNGAAILQFDLTDADKTVHVKIGISAVSVDNAKRNLQAENANASFDDVRKRASLAWNDRLNTVQIDQAADPAKLTSAQRDNLIKFYTALYHVFGSPTVYSDVNGDLRSMRQPKIGGGYPRRDPAGSVPVRDTVNVADYRYRQVDGKPGSYRTHYTGFSLWDTYRSQAQLLAWLAPRESSDMMQSLTADALQCGAFPHWVDASDDSTPMAGDNALNVMAGAYKFGATHFDVVAAARLMKQSAFNPASACNNNASAPNLADYLTTHYYTSANSGHPSSEQIERINSDRSAAAFLQALPASVLADPSVQVKQADIDSLFKRASWWTNIYDPASKTLAARAAPPSGSAPGTLGPLTAGSFHESTEPNYFWSFAHDWTALIHAIGGKAAAVARLNKLFSIDTAFSVTPGSAELNGGESSNGYYIGNEPSFQAPWAYNWAGAPSAAQYVIPIVMSKAFSAGRDGLPGNDDMGATSSWYVWAALGMFPVIPSEAGLALSTPQFDGVTVWFGDGKKLRIETDKPAVDETGRASQRFIRSLKLNGADYAGSWLPLGSIANGGTLRYALSPVPTDWAAADSLTPPSGANADYARMTASAPPDAARTR